MSPAGIHSGHGIPPRPNSVEDPNQVVVTTKAKGKPPAYITAIKQEAVEEAGAAAAALAVGRVYIKREVKQEVPDEDSLSLEVRDDYIWEDYWAWYGESDDEEWL